MIQYLGPMFLRILSFFSAGSPTCDDGVKNQCETGLDCGGTCPKCATCDDKVQNQGEDDIDCGGPCKACPTCDDGTQNQGETGVDCGGPCNTCCQGIKNMMHIRIVRR